MIHATDCICGRHLLQAQNEGTCLLCGHGLADSIPEVAYRRNLEHNRAPALSSSAPRLELAADRAVATTRHRSAPSDRWTVDACVHAAREWERVHGRLPTSTNWTVAQRDCPTYHRIRHLFGGWSGFMREIADVPRERIAA